MTTSEKKTRGMVQHVMHRAGILEGTWNIPGQYKINVERLNTITDMELAHVKGCGDVILDLHPPLPRQHQQSNEYNRVTNFYQPNKAQQQ